jgi:hypothetical protein
MAQTFDTSRVGGGTYELEQDASGNYKLKSVGFNQVNKLNLPDVKDLNLPKTTATKDTTTNTTNTADPFKKLSAQNTGGGEGGGQDYSAIAPREAKVKEASVSELGQKTNTTYNAMTNAEKNAIATGTSGMSFKGAGATTKQYTNPEKYGMSVTTTNPMDIKEQAALGNKAQFETFMGDAVTMDGPYSMSTAKTYSTPRTIADQNKFLGRTFTDKTTGLQKVTSAVSNTVQNIMNNSATVAVAKGVGKVIGGIANAMVSPEQQINNSANMTALNNAGLQTNFQLGRMTDPGRIAASPQDSVFGGMNAQSATGDISAGAASRISTRNNIGQARVDAKYGKNSKKAKDFAAKTKEFEKELQKHNNVKNSEKEAAKTKDTKSTNPNKRAGASDGGGNNSRVICTYFYSKNQFNLIDLQLDTEFSRNNLSDEVKIGYWFWAIPLVDWMKKHENSNNWWVKLVKNSTKLFAQERAKEIAYTMGKKNKGSLIGKFVRLFGETGCYILGLIIKPFVFNKYKGFLNEYQKDVNLIGKI